MDDNSQLSKLNTNISSQKFKQITNNDNHNYHFFFLVAQSLCSRNCARHFTEFLQLILPSLMNTYYFYNHFTDEKTGAYGDF